MNDTSKSKEQEAADQYCKINVLLSIRDYSASTKRVHAAFRVEDSLPEINDESVNRKKC